MLTLEFEISSCSNKVLFSNMPLITSSNQTYFSLIIVAGICAAALVYRRQQSAKKNITVTTEFVKFQTGFMLIYCLAVAADWLQGPYVYALYKEYGYSEGEIGVLFVAGFGSSAIFGTVVGSLADKYGRKNNVLVFFAIYALACVTKFFSNYYMLMLGRVLGGIATSILFSAFEAWMVTEHKGQGFPDEWMDQTFTKMSTMNSIIAVLAGIFGGMLASGGGLVAPFAASGVLLVVGGVIVFGTWKENYGNADISAGFALREGFKTMTENPRLALIGFVQTAFESSMYIFVFLWTPVLEASAAPHHLPHGLVFALFMISIMIGSNLFTNTSKAGQPEYILRSALAVAAACLAVPVITDSHLLQLIAFCGFEMCCGIYFPLQGSIRAKYVPGELRATIMNLYRVGQNGVVVATLMNIGSMDNTVVFVLCVVMLLFATLCQHNLIEITSGSKSSMTKAMNDMHDIVTEENDENDTDASHGDLESAAVSAVYDVESEEDTRDTVAKGD